MVLHGNKFSILTLRGNSKNLVVMPQQHLQLRWQYLVPYSTVLLLLFLFFKKSHKRQHYYYLRVSFSSVGINQDSVNAVNLNAFK